MSNQSTSAIYLLPASPLPTETLSTVTAFFPSKYSPRVDLLLSLNIFHLPLQETNLHLPALGAALNVTTQNKQFLKVSRFKELSRGDTTTTVSACTVDGNFQYLKILVRNNFSRQPEGLHFRSSCFWFSRVHWQMRSSCALQPCLEWQQDGSF